LNHPPIYANGKLLGHFDADTGRICRVDPKPVAPVSSWDQAFDRTLETTGAQRYVYFIGDASIAIKIGIAGSVQARVKMLQVASPIKLSILAARPGNLLMEQAYHSRFSAHRLHGEWFAPHPEILAEIEHINSL
jgi:hypothetical protein